MPKNIPANIPAFLAAYAVCGNVTEAAKAAGFERQTVYDRLKNDPDFPAQFEGAKAEFVDSLKREALRRAREGTRKYLFSQGQPVYLTKLRIGDDGQPMRDGNGIPILDYQLDANGHPIQAYESAFSDRLLLAMLAATDPAEYAPKNNVQLTGADGGPVKVEQSPTEVARRIAFTLHRGMLAARQAASVPDDPGGDLI